MLPLIYAGRPPAERRDRAVDILQKIGMGHRLNHFPAMLSGGEQQRVAIARSLVNNPSLILADEPTGNLPSNMRTEVMAIFRGLHKNGVTLVIVTHDEAVAEYGHRRICIEDGRILSDRKAG